VSVDLFLSSLSPLCLSLSVSLSLSLSLSISLSLSLSLCLSLSLSLCLSVYLFVSLCLCLPPSLCVSLTLTLSLSLFVPLRQMDQLCWSSGRVAPSCGVLVPGSLSEVARLAVFPSALLFDRRVGPDGVSDRW
jgi:hypothetical protein